MLVPEHSACAGRPEELFLCSLGRLRALPAMRAQGRCRFFWPRRSTAGPAQCSLSSWSGTTISRRLTLTHKHPHPPSTLEIAGITLVIAGVALHRQAHPPNRM